MALFRFSKTPPATYSRGFMEELLIRTESGVYAMTVRATGLDWIIDYTYLIRGGVLIYLHRRPPEHYLGYIIEGKQPVILIPGASTQWGFLKPLGDYLSIQGHPVYVVQKLGNNLKDIPTSAQLVRELIDEENINGAVIVAHSKGGLIGKYLLEFHNKDNRVKGVVSIATPYFGSALANLVPWLDAYRELRVNSKMIKKLKGYQEVNKKIISIIPEFDNHIWAEGGSFLEGALDNIVVPVRGHHKVVFDKLVWRKVDEAIDRLASSK